MTSTHHHQLFLDKLFLFDHVRDAKELQLLLDTFKNNKWIRINTGNHNDKKGKKKKKFFLIVITQTIVIIVSKYVTNGVYSFSAVI
jgi:hypothetical protein